MLGGLARELGSWQLGPQLAWAYLHTDEHLAQLAEQLTVAPPQLELQLLAEAGDSRQLDLGSAGAGGVAGGGARGGGWAPCTVRWLCRGRRPVPITSNCRSLLQLGLAELRGELRSRWIRSWTELSTKFLGSFTISEEKW